MLRYKVIENILFQKLYVTELVDRVFYFICPQISTKWTLYIENKTILEKNYKTIKSIYMTQNHKTELIQTRCAKCFHIISFQKHQNNKVANLFNYIDCVEHNKNTHELEQNFENTILHYIEKINSI